MINHHYIIASGGGDFVFFLIIAVAIIARIINAFKGGNKGQQQQQNGGNIFGQGSLGNEGTDAEDELKKFLKSLGGAQPVSEEPQDATEPFIPAPTPPVARIPPRSALPTVSSRREPQFNQEERIQVDVSPVYKAQPMPVQIANAIQDLPVSHAPMVHMHTQPHRLKASIAHDLKNSEMLRKAIVLREILGPALGLRRTGAGM